MKLDQSLQRITVTFLTLLLLAGTSALYAQSRAGTSGSPQLQIPMGAQYLDGSGAAAGMTGIGSVLWNPAGLDRGDGDISVMVSRREHLADIGANFIGVGVSFEDIGTFALHLRNFDIGEIKETTEFESGGTGGTFEPTFFTIGASYGLAITDRISVGVTSNVTNESFANISATNVTFDAGVQYASFLGFEDLDLGVSVRNIGTSMQYGGSGLLTEAEAGDANRGTTQYQVLAADAEIPTVVDLSLDYNLWRGLNVQATYSENTFQPSEVQGQLAYNFRDLITARTSYTQLTEDRGDLESPYENQIRFGASLNLESAIGVPISFDYGFIPTQFFPNNNHILSLRGSF